MAIPKTLGIETEYGIVHRGTDKYYIPGSNNGPAKIRGAKLGFNGTTGQILNSA